MNPAWRYVGGTAALRTTKPHHDLMRMQDMRDRLCDIYMRRFNKRFARQKEGRAAGDWETVGELEISANADYTMGQAKRDRSLPIERPDRDALAKSMPTRIYDTCSNELRPPETFERYMAVSYVWTQYSSVEDIVEDMRHIIEVTRINCLWIDRVCINQADPQDKAREIPRMGEYYSEASLVVALLPDVKVPARLMSWVDGLRYQVKNAGRDLLRLYDRLESSQWMHRVWTFQEAALAQSLLLVTETATIDEQDYTMVSGLQEHLKGGECDYNAIGWRPWRRHQPACCNGYGCGGGGYGGEDIFLPDSRLQVHPGRKWNLDSLPELWEKAGPRGCLHPEDHVYGYLGLLHLPPDVPVVYGIGFENLMQVIFRKVTRISTKILISHPSHVEGCCWLPSISNESHTLHVGDAQRVVEVLVWGLITTTGMMKFPATFGRVEVETEMGQPFVSYCGIETKNRVTDKPEQRQILVTNSRTETPDDLYTYDALFVPCKYEDKGATMIIWGKAKKKGVFHRKGACVVSGVVRYHNTMWKVGARDPRSARKDRCN